MNVYLPIAGMSVNIFLILGLGGIGGILSGMFGIGGGFLLTPLLIFIGVAPSVSASTVANQLIASSVSGFLLYWRKDQVDFKMGWYLLIGGLLGSSVGVGMFSWLKSIGYIDLIISVVYVIFLGGIGALMVGDSIRAILKSSKKHSPASQSQWAARLPFKTEFPKSKLTVSLLMPAGIGFFVGILASLMGVGGGFILVPAMIYLIGMPTSVVIGTSLFQIMFITTNVTILQAMTTQTVDVLLAFLLLTGSVFGVQLGSKLAVKLSGDYLRALLAALVLGVAIKLAFGLFTPPADVYSVSAVND